MPIDKFRLYLSAATYRNNTNRIAYIYDIVASISGLFGKPKNKTIKNHIETLEM